MLLDTALQTKFPTNAAQIKAGMRAIAPKKGAPKRQEPNRHNRKRVAVKTKWSLAQGCGITWMPGKWRRLHLNDTFGEWGCVATMMGAGWAPSFSV